MQREFEIYMPNVPNDGILVTFIRPGKEKPRSETIKFHGNRYYLMVHEILEFFGVKKLAPGEKIWIKRKDTSNVRQKSYELTAQLPWEDFSKCTVIIAPDYESAMSALNNPPLETKSVSLEERYEQSLGEQFKLWQEKKSEKKARKSQTPKSVLMRQKLSE